MIEYIRLSSGQPLPDITGYAPSKAVVVIETDIKSAWREEISRWLVNGACYYVMVWGRKCAAWEDVIDQANLELFPDVDVPDKGLVMTTHHEGELLRVVFAFCKNFAVHDCHDLQNVLLVHLADVDKKGELLKEYAEA